MNFQNFVLNRYYINKDDKTTIYDLTVVKKLLLLYSIKNDTIDTAFTNDRIPIRNNRFRDSTQKNIHKK